MTDETKNAQELAEDAEVNPKVADQTSQVYVADPTNATAPPGEAPQASSDGSAGRTNVPIWVLVVVVALFLACLCAMMLAGAGAVGILSSQQSDAPDAPVIIVPPTQEQPTQAPPEPEAPQEQPTQAQPEPEAPQEQPTQAQPEPPAGEQPEKEPPSGEQPPADQDGSGLPCVPLAGGLVLAPLLVIGKKNAIGRRLNW
jgi:hypothetical protein